MEVNELKKLAGNRQQGVISWILAIINLNYAVFLFFLLFFPPILQILDWEIPCVQAQVYPVRRAPSSIHLLHLTPTERNTAGRKARAISKLMASRAQLKVSLLRGGSLNFENIIPKSIFKYSSATLLALYTEGGDNCVEVEKLKTDLVMMKLNNMGHHDGEFDCLKHVWN